MFSAEEARRMSKSNKFKNSIREELESKLTTAVENGEFECKVDIPDCTPIELVRDLILYLEDAGYTVQDFTSFEGDKYIKIFWDME